MFVIFATKSLNDRTAGFRFNVLGKKGLFRKRKAINRGWCVDKQDCMTAYHMGKVSLYVEHKASRRKLKHFAG